MERRKLASLILIIALGGLSGVLGVQSISLMNQNTISQSDYQQAYENWQDALANYDQAYQDYLEAQQNYQEADQNYQDAYQDYLEAQQNYETTYQDYQDALADYQAAQDQLDLIGDNTDFSGSFYTTIEYKVNYNGLFNTRNTATYTSYQTYFDYRLNFLHPSHSYVDKWIVADVIASYCINSSKIYSIASGIKGSCLNPNNDEEVIDALLSYCQDKGSCSKSIRYVSDGVDDFAKYPIETIAEGCGDCEDKSILFGSFAFSLGFSAAIFVITGHAFVGVHLESAPTHNSQYPSRWYLNIGGDYYYTCETTMDGWLVGDLPASSQGQSVYYEIIS